MVATRSSRRPPGRSAEPRSTTVAGPRGPSSCSALSKAPASCVPARVLAGRGRLSPVRGPGAGAEPEPEPQAEAEAGRAAGQPDHGTVGLRRRVREGLRECRAGERSADDLADDPGLRERGQLGVAGAAAQHPRRAAQRVPRLQGQQARRDPRARHQHDQLAGLMWRAGRGPIGLTWPARAGQHDGDCPEVAAWDAGPSARDSVSGAATTESWV